MFVILNKTTTKHRKLSMEFHQMNWVILYSNILTYVYRFDGERKKFFFFVQ